jgi:hypothetical protein
MDEMVATSEYAAWLAVMVEGSTTPIAAAGDAGDPRPDLVPRPAYRALYLAGRVVGVDQVNSSDWSK